MPYFKIPLKFLIAYHYFFSCQCNLVKTLFWPYSHGCLGYISKNFAFRELTKPELI